MNTSNLSCDVYYSQISSSSSSSSINEQAFHEKCRKYKLTVEIVLAVTFGVLILGTLLGNGLVILAVTITQRLRTPNNILIVSLAVSDMLVSILVLPLATVYQIKGYWMFDETICDIFIVCDVLLCTASILNLCAICIDRYLVITKPFKYIVRRNNRLMLSMVTVTWCLSALISIPPLFGWKQPFNHGKCLYSDDLAYQIYATFGAFYIPTMVMLVLYGRIYQIAKRSAATADSQMRSVRHSLIRGNLTAHSGNSSYKSSQSDVQSHASINGYFRCVPTKKPSIYRSCTTSDLTQTCQLTLPSKRPVRNSFPGIIDSRSKSAQCSRNNSKHSHSIMAALSVSRDTLTTRWKSIIHSSRRQSQSDSKATFTLGIIMGCFCICWLPFFIIQILTPIFKIIQKSTNSQGNEPLNIPTSLNELFLWLGYFNSFLNPIIYVKFNEEFYTPFKEILFCRCRQINARVRSESYMRQIGEFKKLSKLSITLATGKGRNQSLRYNSVKSTIN